MEENPGILYRGKTGRDIVIHVAKKINPVKLLSKGVENIKEGMDDAQPFEPSLQIIEGNLQIGLAYLEVAATIEMMGAFQGATRLEILLFREAKAAKFPFENIHITRSGTPEQITALVGGGTSYIPGKVLIHPRFLTEKAFISARKKAGVTPQAAIQHEMGHGFAKHSLATNEIERAGIEIQATLIAMRLRKAKISDHYKKLKMDFRTFSKQNDVHKSQEWLDEKVLYMINRYVILHSKKNQKNIKKFFKDK